MMKINKFYDIFLFGGSINGTAYRNAQLISILSYDMAKKFESIDALEKQYRPFLPDETPRDFRNFTYYQFKIGNEMKIFADYWMIPGRTEERNGVDVIFKLNNVDNSDIIIVSNQLRLLGIDFTIEE